MTSRSFQFCPLFTNSTTSICKQSTKLEGLGVFRRSFIFGTHFSFQICNSWNCRGIFLWGQHHFIANCNGQSGPKKFLRACSVSILICDFAFSDVFLTFRGCEISINLLWSVNSLQNKVIPKVKQMISWLRMYDAIH